MKKNKWTWPNWERKLEYPDPDRTTARQWAWEFLRRNPEYKRLYAEYDNLSIKKPVSESPFFGYSNSSQKLNYCRMYENNDNATQANFILQDILKKFSVRVLPDGDLLAPDDNDTEHLAFTHDFYPPFITFRNLPLEHGLFNDGSGFGGFLVPIVPTKKNEITIKFDPSYSLDAQLEAARITLQRQWGENKKNRSRGKQYVVYIRILDALDLGIDKSKIKSTLYPELEDEYPELEATKRLSKHQKKAEELRDKGYIALIRK